MWTKLWVLAGVTLGLLTAILFACSGGGGGNATGAVRVSVADQPGGLQSVVMTITDVGVVSNIGGTTYQHLTVPIKVDILDINFQEGYSLQIADILVGAGKYNQFRLVLAENGGRCIPTDPAPSDCANYVVDQGVVYPLKTPSGHTSGLKIKSPSSFDVGAGQTVDIVLDIVPENAIHLISSDEEYTIDPTGIRIVEGTIVSGSAEELTREAAGELVGLVRVNKMCVDDFPPNDPTITPIFTVTAGVHTTMGIATMVDGEYLAGSYVFDVPTGTYDVAVAWEGLSGSVSCSTGAQPCATIDLPAGGCSN